MEEEEEIRSSVKTGKKVLIAMDGSKHSVEAFEWYVENIHKSADIVILAYSAKHDHRLSSSSSTEDDTEPESQEEQTKRVFRCIEGLANKHRIRHILQLIHEPVGESVVMAARQKNVDMIFAGGRQHGEFGQAMGSTSNFITRYSDIPVMIYKYTDDTGLDHMKEYKRSRSESFGDRVKSIWKKDSEYMKDDRQRSASFSDRVKAVMKIN